MDPQTVAFQPQNDLWRFQHELQRLQVTQAEHADRLLRIERKQDDDTRMKSVWGGASPFPSILSGTPQQTPLHQPTSDAFKNFDDESANLINSLHLDADEEPRRIGATSRANSVRFDESANQGHWSHPSRSSMDLMRSSGGLPMSERTASHKSEGRASSVHSIRSLASGRASSLNIDTAYGFGDSARSPDETPGLAPGMLILGPVPAIIRCWMNANFRHDALLYAAVCSGSHKSFVDRRLVDKLSFGDRIISTTSGVQTVMLPVYLPEAIPHPGSTRTGSPAPQIPTLTVTFTVVEGTDLENSGSKGIQIVLGSDTLRVHLADILFSTNRLSILDDERNKLSIPLVRPEDERTFNCLRTSAGSEPHSHGETLERVESIGAPVINGLGQSKNSSAESMPTLVVPKSSMSQKSPVAVPADTAQASVGASDTSDDDGQHLPPARSIRFAQLPSSGIESTAPVKEDDTPRSDANKSASTSAIWSNWRQRGQDASPGAGATDYSGIGRSREMGQRKESGMKVLRPTRTASRNASTTTATITTPSSQDGRSRFFDEGKRRPSESPVPDHGREWGSGGGGHGGDGTSSSKDGTQDRSSAMNTHGPIGPARVNPAGSGSAFSWLKTGTAR